MPSPNSSTRVNNVTGIAVVSPNDIWASGNYLTEGFDVAHQILHWNGTAWSLVPSPTFPDSELNAITALSPTDVWAVGSHNNETDTLTMHWDGVSWTQFPSPNGSEVINQLLAVHAISSNDVWAVGYWMTANYSNRTLTLHWNGTQWELVPSPNVLPSDNGLHDVAAVASDDVWAVGAWFDDLANVRKTLVLRWDGSQWNVIPSPNPGTNGNDLTSLQVFSGGDIWAVGMYNHRPAPQKRRTLTIHWDGTQWDVVTSPNIDNTHHELASITATSPTDIWAVGYYGYSDGHPIPLPLSMHWDGSQWNIVPVPVTGYGGRLNAVAAVSLTDAWAVGQYDDGITGRTLIQRYSDPCVTPTPTVTGTPPTNTPQPTRTSTGTRTVTRTRTSTPTLTATPAAPSTATSTPPRTPTTCTVQFSDVPPTHTFYPYVRCLACRGIVQGYPDGSFRPDSNVTRGQLTKIVSESAGFSEPVIGQSFEDVAPGSTFYEYVERLAVRQVMSGYLCGGSGEPCGPDQRPYFRPSANSTRGQLTKIVSNAAGFQDTIPPGTQTFADVAEGSTFHLYVERLLLNRPGVMAGYPCGGQGEPCDPQSRPYFRPNNTLTRGQTAKIVSNTYFPGCSP